MNIDKSIRVVVSCLLVAWCSLTSDIAPAHELAPRAYWPAPVGTNRLAMKPALGMIVPLLPTWLFEIEVGAWLFGDNDDFLTLVFPIKGR